MGIEEQIHNERLLGTPEDQIRRVVVADLNAQREEGAGLLFDNAVGRLQRRRDNRREHAANRRQNYIIRENQRILQFRIAIRRSIDELQSEPIEEIFMGNLTRICPFGNCRARYWPNEATSRNVYTKCCSEGKVQLPPFPDPTPYIKGLLLNNDDESKAFLSKPRYFNTKSSFASICMKDYHFPRGGIPTLRIHGSVYHRLGAIFPEPNQAPRFLQCFFHQSEYTDADYEFNARQRAVHRRIMDELRELNPIYLEIHGILSNDANNEVRNAAPYTIQFAEDLRPNNAHERVYNAPIDHGQTSAIIIGNGDDDYAGLHRSIAIRRLRGLNDYETQIIPSFNSLHDPLAYTIMHPRGTRGWSDGIRRLQFVNNAWQPEDKNITMLDFAAFRCQIRDVWQNNQPPVVLSDSLLYFGTLSQQYLVDQYVKIEEERLGYIRHNQMNLRAAEYEQLQRAVNENDEENAGNRVILPSTFIGSPRHCTQNFNDAMAIVAKYGKPDLFITFTCNPDWDEILLAMQLPHEQPYMRADIVSRVFYMKLKALLKDIQDYEIFGKPLAMVHVVEFQKRGLPHAHILLILKQEHKPTTPDDIDKYVCAEIPNEDRHPTLRRIILRNNIHGPCGELNPHCICMKD